MPAIGVLLEAVEAKDPGARAHSISVANLSAAFGQRMALSSSAIRNLRVAALLHDIGKIGIPDAILTKRGPLTLKEFEIIKTHPAIGVRILRQGGAFRELSPIILHHHERFDGLGYPGRLKQQQIPMGSRILCVADAIETMSAARTYKQPFGTDRIRSELIAGAGHQFDPEVVDVALEWLDETRPPRSPTDDRAPLRAAS